jgi:hypothetical protein
VSPQQLDAVRRRVVADRRAQGLADHVTDPAVLRRVAAVLSTRQDPADQAGSCSDRPSPKERSDAKTT